MTELILIRHGETTWNRERRMQGQLDTALSDLGFAQAEATGARMANHAFTTLYSSDLKRAHDTASAISRASGKPIISDPALRERAFGIFEGLTADEISRQYPVENERFVARDPDFVVPGGESARGFYQRALGCMERIAERHRGECVVVVTHGLVLDTMYRAARNMPIEPRREAPLYNASLNIFRREAQGWIEVMWGDVSHLAEVGVTDYRGRAA
jgi:probable phosphoglycerate mutase